MADVHPPKLTSKTVKQHIMSFRRNVNRCKRYASYDFCSSYFYSKKGQLSSDMQTSCLLLWSYLTSWGMLRNSKLLECSPAALEPLIEYFDKDITLWEIDVDNYNVKNIGKLLKAYHKISEILRKKVFSKNSKLKGIQEPEPTKTLVTKIMLGVYGNIPAFDINFVNAFQSLYGGFKTNVNEKNLEKIHQFYLNHVNAISKLQLRMPVMDFYGHMTGRCYTKAKLIDMFGFIYGQKIVKP